VTLNPEAALALALDAFLAEHRGCWRLHGEGLRLARAGRSCGWSVEGAGLFCDFLSP
jgi:hypothetical protein